MKRSSALPPSPLKRPPWAVVGVALLPVVGGLLLFGRSPHTAALRPPPALAQGAPFRPVPQFSSSPTPEGDVSLQNLHFPPLEFSGFPAFISRLKVAYRDGTVTITDTEKNPKTITDAGENEGAKDEAVVWSGPATAASFIQETTGGIHTLKDSDGKVLWSDAADLAKPDLLFQRRRMGDLA